MLTLSGSAFQPINGTPFTNVDITTSITETINMYSSTDVIYEISHQISLKSFSSSADTYTLYILSPYGYAIFLSNSTCMMEACLQPGARIPYDKTFVGDYYYGGPGNYYFIENGTYKHATTGQILSQEQTDSLSSAEARVLSSVVSNLKKQSNTVQQSNRSTAASEYVSEFVAPSYFNSLQYFGSNTNGTCTIVAIAILLGYYDYYVNDSYVGTAHEYGNGTNNEFHLYLNNLVYGTPTPTPNGGISIQDAAQTINTYLDSRGLITELHPVSPLLNSSLTNSIILYIKNDMPVVASTSENNGADWNHTVVIYGVVYNTANPAGTAVYTVHMGWDPFTTNYTSNQINACWFTDCAYIDCGTNWHAQGLVWNDVDINYHEITCHCGIYLKERHESYIDPSTGYCTKCGRKFNVVPEINSTTTEELN